MTIIERIRNFARLEPGLSEKPAQLKCYLPNEATKVVLDRRRYDLAALESKSVGEVTTEALISSLLPSVPEAIEPVAKVLLGSGKAGNTDEYAIVSVLASLFRDNCDGALMEVRHVNFFPLLDFGYVYLLRGSHWGDSESMLRFRQDAVNYWGILIEELEEVAPRSYVERRIDLQRTLSIWHEMFLQLKEGQTIPYPPNFIRLIKDNWDIFHADVNAYRFVAAMLSSVVVERDDYCDQRNDFQDACESVMSAWGDPEREQSETAKVIESKLSMRTIALAGGDVCRVPSDFVVLDEQSAHSSSYVFACEVYNYKKYNCPQHMLIFSNVDITEWRESGQETAVLEDIAEVFPGILEGVAKSEPIIFSPLPDGPSCAQKPPCCAAIYRSGWDA